MPVVIQKVKKNTFLFDESKPLIIANNTVLIYQPSQGVIFSKNNHNRNSNITHRTREDFVKLCSGCFIYIITSINFHNNCILYVLVS